MRKEDKDIRRTNVRTWKCRKDRGFCEYFSIFCSILPETARGFPHGDFSASFTHAADFTIADNIRISINATFRLLAEETRGSSVRARKWRCRRARSDWLDLFREFTAENLANVSRLSLRPRRDLVAVNYSRWDHSSPARFYLPSKVTPPDSRSYSLRGVLASNDNDISLSSLARPRSSTSALSASAPLFLQTSIA